LYELRLYREKRINKPSNKIILTQAINLIDSDYFINGEVYKTNYKYTWGIWQKYFIEFLRKPALPFHYFTEFLDKDYVEYKGLPNLNRSYFLDELANAGIIEYKYKNCILIGIGENWNIDIPERRFYDHLAQKILIPLMREHHLNVNDVLILEDCFTSDWENKLEKSELNYKFYNHKYYDKVILKTYINKWDKFK